MQNVKRVSLKELYPLMQEILEEDGQVSFVTTGTSMYPMLRDRMDKVKITKIVTHPLKKYDLVFYQRRSGQFVLHRIIDVKKDSYTMRGDNQYVNEEGIQPDQCLAIVEEFERNQHVIRSDNLLYQIYVKLWVNTMKPRHFLSRCRAKVRRIGKGEG